MAEQVVHLLGRLDVRGFGLPVLCALRTHPIRRVFLVKDDDRITDDEGARLAAWCRRPRSWRPPLYR